MKPSAGIAIIYLIHLGETKKNKKYPTTKKPTTHPKKETQNPKPR